MKRSPIIVALLMAAFAFSFAAPALAQDPLKVAPGMYKLLSENDRIRVMEVTLAPGAKIEKHSHPDHMAYALSGGKLKINNGDGTSMDADMKTGEVLWLPAVTHWAENVGDTTVRILVVELKEAAKKEVKADKVKTE